MLRTLRMCRPPGLMARPTARFLSAALSRLPMIRVIPRGVLLVLIITLKAKALPFSLVPVVLKNLPVPLGLQV